MTNDKDMEVKGTGYHLTVHDLLENALTQAKLFSQLDEGNPEDIWNLYYAAKNEADVLLEENPKHKDALKFREESEAIDKRYGAKVEGYMTKEEWRERLNVAHKFFRRRGAFKLAEREEEWRDVTLELIEKEERGK
jgi:hypothetical protein